MALSRFCFFDQKTSELAAVTLSGSNDIMKLSPYQLTEGELPLFQESQTVNQETAALEKEETLAFVIIQKMRDQKELESFGMA